MPLKYYLFNIKQESSKDSLDSGPYSPEAKKGSVQVSYHGNRGIPDSPHPKDTMYT